MPSKDDLDDDGDGVPDDEDPPSNGYGSCYRNPLSLKYGYCDKKQADQNKQ